jgi:radical SAM family protein
MTTEHSPSAGRRRRQLPIVAGFDQLRAHTAPGVLVQNPELTGDAEELLRNAKTVEIFRPYHGVTVHGDMSGDLGAAYPQDTPRPDLTMVMVAAVLQAAGREVTVRDDNAAAARSAEPQGRPDVRLVKAQLATWEADLQTVRRMRADDPRVPIVVFGGVVSHLAAQETGPSILGDAPNALATLFGVDDVSLGAAYRLLPLERFRTPAGALRVHLQGSRGCNRTCMYCPYIRTLGRWAGRSPAAFRSDVADLVAAGVTEIQFRDQDFASDTEHAIGIARAMGEVAQGRVGWSVEGNLDQFTPELLDAMKEGGADEVIVGIESVDPAVLRNARRKVVTDTTERLEMVVRHGLKARGLFMLGLPEDSWERAGATLAFALGLPIHAAQFNVYSPLPGESFGIDRVATIHDFRPLTNDFSHATCATMTQKEVRLAAAWATHIFAADRAGRPAVRDEYQARFAARIERATQRAAAR